MHSNSLYPNPIGATMMWPNFGSREYQSQCVFTLPNASLSSNESLAVDLLVQWESSDEKIAIEFLTMPNVAEFDDAKSGYQRTLIPAVKSPAKDSDALVSITFDGKDCGDVMETVSIVPNDQM